MRAELDVVRPPKSEPISVSNERELGAIVADMWENGEKLLRQELELALRELEIRVDKLKQSLLMATIGGLTLFAGILSLLAALVLGLSTVMAPWLAALLVGAVITTVGATLIFRSDDKAAESVSPHEQVPGTARAMKEAIK